MQKCSVGATLYDYNNSLEECANKCMEDEECYVFLFDKNDGDCRRVNCGFSCPAPFVSSSYYNMYRINPAAPENVSPPEPVPREPWMVMEG